ncbi:hypothetical protein L9F63_028365, partial [Diploptera punctata]
TQNKCINTRDNKEMTISQSARATPAHPAPTTSINTTPAAFTLSYQPIVGGAQRPNGTHGKICQFKLVLLGESAVGKSSLVLRFVKGQFHEYQESTIGVIDL